MRRCGYEFAEAIHCIKKMKRAFRLVPNVKCEDKQIYLRRAGSTFIMSLRRTA